MLEYGFRIGIIFLVTVTFWYSLYVCVYSIVLTFVLKQQQSNLIYTFFFLVIKLVLMELINE